MAKNEGKGTGLKATIGFDDSALKEGIGALPSSIQGAMSGLGAIGAQLGLAFGVKEIVGEIYSIGTEFDSAMKTIRTGTGATGPALESLKGSFENVFGTVGDDAGMVSTAIADLNTRMGLTGEPLETLATQFLDLSDVTGVDLKQSIASATRVFGDWGIANEEAGGKLDFLFKVSQSTGIEMTALNSKMVAAGAPLRNLGFGFEEAATLMGHWEKTGVNTELVLGGLRQMMNKFSSEGISDVRGGLEEVMQRIKDAGSSGEAAAIGMNFFGKSNNDMVDAIRGGKFEIDELLNTLRQSPETIGGAAEQAAKFADRLDDLKNKATGAVAPIGTDLTGALDNYAIVTLRAINWTEKLKKEIAGEGGANGGLVAAAGATFDGLTKAANPALALYGIFDDLGKGLNWLTTGMDLHEDAQKRLESGYKNVNKAAQEMVKPTEEVGKAHGNVKGQIEALLNKTKDKKDADEKAVAVLRTFKEPLDFYISKMNSAATETERAAYKAIFVEEEFIKWNFAIDGLAADAQTLTDKLASQGKGIDDLANFKVPNLVGKLGEMSVKTGDLNSALGGLGVTSASEYSKIAKDAQAAYDVVAGSKLSTDWEKNTALLKALEAQRAAMVVNGQVIPKEMQAQIDALQRTVADPTTGLGKVTQEFKGFGTEVSTIVTNFTQDINKSLWDGSMSWSEKGKDALQSLGAAFTSKLTQPAMNAIVGPEGLVAKGLKPLSDNLDSLGSKISSILGTTVDAVPGTPSTPGTNPTGGVGGVIGSGAAAWVGAIGSAVTAISSIVGNFQMKGMNDSLSKIEESTRKSMNYLGERSDGGIVMAALATKEYLGYVMDDLRNGPDSIRPMTAGINGNLYWLLKKVEDPGMLVHTMWEVRDNTASIDTTLKSLQGLARVNITNHFNVNGAKSPQDTATEIVDTINRIARLQGAVYGV